ncbi:glycoside hydrolase family 57 protein [Clostridium sediminicola]|uniref:glycoside hydrolase family 57 protein n=1 Tax=Clostridium sediminicola TaxID=3114879 RepID=UPI0031F222AD
MCKGYISIILHSHMPFVRNPNVEDELEERWLFEAMNESYLPLIMVFDDLLKEGVSFKITMSISPTLMEMLEDEYINNRFIKYLNKSIELAEKEIRRTENNEGLNEIAKFYYERFNNLLRTYTKYDNRLMNAFKKFDKIGVLEIITCSATHGLLPLLMINKETVKAQIATAVKSYTEYIGHPPKGIWLPECAYTYYIDSIIKEYGLEYFIAENIAILNASPKPRYGTYAPIVTPTGVSLFGRDIEASQQVWSNIVGYPADINYREFYRDIGHELDMTYVAPYINQNGIRVDTGMKYYKITGNTEEKDIYNRKNAIDRVKEHARHFVNSRNTQIDNVYKHMEAKPIITCPYDTELFGHWWFEGPDFIREILKLKYEKGNEVKLVTPSEYLKENPLVQYSLPTPSSWGKNGDFSVWLNPSNDWIVKELHRCGEAMIELANFFENPTEIQKRALNQAARELMLAEASDWSFIISNNTSFQYATNRVTTHIGRFDRLYKEINNNNINNEWLIQIEKTDNIFANIDYSLYSS